MVKLDASKSGTFKIGGEIEINRLGFGAMRITGKGIWGEPEDRAEALRTLKRVPELGINFIDTADSYGPNVSEELIHEALFPYDGILIATKAGFQRPRSGRLGDGWPSRMVAQPSAVELQAARRETHRPMAIAPYRSESSAEGAIRGDQGVDR